DFEQYLHPARRNGRRQYLVDRTVEELARADPRQTPQTGVHHLGSLHLSDQRVAKLRLGLQRQQLETGSGAPHFAQKAVVKSRPFGAPRQQNRRQTLEDIHLLVLVQPARQPAPENPPVDLILDLIGVLKPGSVDPARLLNTIVVSWKSETWPQAEAAQVEPAQFQRERLA